MNDIYSATLASIRFLSRLPVPDHGPDHGPGDDGGDIPRFNETSWAFPLAGLMIALPAAAIGVAAHWCGLGELATSLTTIAAMIITTGALHEDGLADVADGFWGGHSQARKLEIMRDSAIGTYGTLALIVSLGLRVVLFSHVLVHMGLYAFIVFCAVASLSRLSILHPWSRLMSARAGGTSEIEQDGAKPQGSLAQRYGAPDGDTFNRGLLFGIPAVILLIITLPLFAVIVAVGAVLLATLASNALSRHHIGGFTGDTLGATQQMSELGLFLAIAIAI